MDLHGCMASGAVVVPNNVKLAVVYEIQYISTQVESLWNDGAVATHD